MRGESYACALIMHVCEPTDVCGVQKDLWAMHVEDAG